MKEDTIGWIGYALGMSWGVVPGFSAILAGGQPFMAFATGVVISSLTSILGTVVAFALIDMEPQPSYPPETY